MVSELQTGEKEATSEEENASVEEAADPEQEEQHGDLLHPARDRKGNSSLWGEVRDMLVSPYNAQLEPLTLRSIPT